eukprot:SAG22_NODE_7941_length_696_cov_1.112228_2_plen_119_part_00
MSFEIFLQLCTTKLIKFSTMTCMRVKFNRLSLAARVGDLANHHIRASSLGYTQQEHVSDDYMNQMNAYIFLYCGCKDNPIDLSLYSPQAAVDATSRLQARMELDNNPKTPRDDGPCTA